MNTFIKSSMCAMTLPFIAFPIGGTITCSSIAYCVDERRSAILSRISQTETFGAIERLRGLLSPEGDFVRKRSVEGWRGDDSEPISMQSLFNATAFLSRMPCDIKKPKVGVYPNGHVFFRWHKSSYRQLTVAIDDKGVCHYSHIHGGERTAASTNSIEIILKSIESVYA